MEEYTELDVSAAAYNHNLKSAHDRIASIVDRFTTPETESNFKNVVAVAPSEESYVMSLRADSLSKLSGDVESMLIDESYFISSNDISNEFISSSAYHNKLGTIETSTRHLVSKLKNSFHGLLTNLGKDLQRKEETSIGHTQFSASKREKSIQR
jgi:hypothetical protein